MSKRSVVSTTENHFDMTTTLHLSDGSAITVDQREFDLGGRLPVWLASMEIASEGKRVDVFQYGRKVGEVPDFWHPGIGQSSSPLYDFRHSDLVRDGDKWVAARNLGASDLDCLIGFVRKDAS